MNLQQALSFLGQTPEAIARTLQEQGIKGIVLDALACPVACYLRMYCGYWRVSVSPSNIVWNLGLQNGIRPTPDTVADFLRRFDAKQYPYLISG